MAKKPFYISPIAANVRYHLGLEMYNGMELLLLRTQGWEPTSRGGF